MADAKPPVVRLVNPAPKRSGGNIQKYVPEPVHRQLVEILVAVGASNEAICRELGRQGLPCKNVRILRRAFKEELAHGKERRVLAYGVKMHSIAMSDAAGNVGALKFMLGVLGGRMWQNIHDAEMPEIPQTYQEVVHFYMPGNGRDKPIDDDEDGPVIEGEPVT
jgi:hypothetical protein